MFRIPSKPIVGHSPTQLSACEKFRVDPLRRRRIKNQAVGRRATTGTGLKWEGSSAVNAPWTSASVPRASFLFREGRPGDHRFCPSRRMASVIVCDLWANSPICFFKRIVRLVVSHRYLRFAQMHFTSSLRKNPCSSVAPAAHQKPSRRTRSKSKESVKEPIRAYR